ncbi:elongin-C [Iris pallida]|uniref:Elongin-C n=1 Tax=Iris pallida TaxID=29817 RepID=A0AAX6E424_IRIPA|nr:elongin-C [Iris pallida]
MMLLLMVSIFCPCPLEIQRGSTTNLAPWMMSVAASTIDRKIIDRLVTGDGEIIEGTSINTYDMGNELYPFTYGGLCGDLDDSVKGKIVLCNLRDEGSGLLRAGAKGAVMVEEHSSYVASTFLLPAIVVGSDGGEKLRKYIKGSAKPVARIERTSTVVDSAAPFVAPFSSRGPNRLVPDILKPDVSAPGLNILSAWSPEAAIPGYADAQSLQYNFMTGTSSSCPHAAGAAAYVKSFHRDWSPAAIRSALMTTALPMDPSKNSDAEFAFGAGQINPVAATNPGLVYDVGVDDYILTLCGIGYNSSDIGLISGEERTCPSDYKGSPRDLNYPSMALRIDTGTPYRANFSRTVKNVGAESSVYNASIETSGKIDVKVEPAALTFGSLNEKQSFVVTVSWHEGLALGELARATLTWSDGLHNVRSPIVVYTFV